MLPLQGDGTGKRDPTVHREWPFDLERHLRNYRSYGPVQGSAFFHNFVLGDRPGDQTAQAGRQPNRVGARDGNFPNCHHTFVNESLCDRHNQFTASTGVKWSANCGAIGAQTGLYTAPPSARSCTITATASSGIAYTAKATVSVSVINYTTFLGNNARTGAQTQERVLTSGNVNSTSFGLAWSMALDGGIWTQPLYMNALTVNGAPHNVVFETTAQDSVYAIDADNGTLLWKRSFLSSGVTSVPGALINCSMDPVGIVGTPVIDTAAKTMYVVAMSAENNNTLFIHRLHAIDITTGLERPNSPVTFAAPGFEDYKQLQRPGLLLANSRIYVGFGGIRDSPPYQGFVFAFNTGTLRQAAAFSDGPTDADGGGGGIWMGGTGPSTDASGNIYVITGNGDADGFRNFGQSVIKLSRDLAVLDYFTPHDHAALSSIDADLGGGGALIVPDQTGPYAHELIMCGKPTPIYVLNRDNMGKIGTSSDNIIQRLDGVIGQTGSFRDSGMPCFSTPSFWQQNVYIVANHDVMKRFTLNPDTGLLSTTPASQGTFQLRMARRLPGGFRQREFQRNRVDVRVHNRNPAGNRCDQCRK